MFEDESLWAVERSSAESTFLHTIHAFHEAARHEFRATVHFSDTELCIVTTINPMHQILSLHSFRSIYALDRGGKGEIDPAIRRLLHFKALPSHEHIRPE